jgi:hypothetical protein
MPTKTIATTLFAFFLAVAGANAQTNAVRAIPPEYRALAWLAQQQRPDGFWGSDSNRVKLTSLATLAFFAIGETPVSTMYYTTLTNALDALFRISDDAKIKLNIEEQALYTWALAEVYGITQHPSFHDAVEKQAAILTVDHPNVAFTRSNNYYRAFSDGVLQGGPTLWSGTFKFGYGSQIIVGANGSNNPIDYTRWFTGYIDEVRISNICRYVGNFTPTGPFVP